MSNRNSSAICATCAHWLAPAKPSAVNVIGACKRFPPVILPRFIGATDKVTVKEVSVGQHVPHTMGADWCGEHKYSKAYG